MRGSSFVTAFAVVVALVVAIFAATSTSTIGPTASATETNSTVTVGGHTHVLNGVNVERKAQDLVAFTRTATQTVTPTNSWGVEVTISGGKVLAINDRWSSSGGPTPIPHGAIVLSGHDNARDWLLANAKIGLSVFISGAPQLAQTTTSRPAIASSSAPSPSAQSPHPLPVTSSSSSKATPTISATAPVSTGGLPATTTAPSVPVTQSAPSATQSRWLSGAAGEGVAKGSFAAWRGAPVDVAGTWSDGSATDQTELWGLQPGLEYGNWTGSADIAIGAIFQGETWAAAAQGAYDGRWTQSLTQAKKLWTSKTRGTLYIRFAHEWNGNWTPWSVGIADLENFKAAWKRFYNLKQAIFPAAKLVFCSNGDTAGQSYDWRAGWPGDAFVDVYATDWYSMHWKIWGANGVDRFGGPAGLEAHRQFALAHRKPFAVAEWGNNIDVGDQPGYIQFMHDFFTVNGGEGAGKLCYEIYFNVIWSPNKFGLFPESSSMATNAAVRYRNTF